MAASIERALKTKVALARINMKRGSTYSYLKPLQCQSITAALEQDTVIVLPTGYGKSLIFETILEVNQKKAVIISPLNANM